MVWALLIYFWDEGNRNRHYFYAIACFLAEIRLCWSCCEGTRTTRKWTLSPHTQELLGELWDKILGRRMQFRQQHVITCLTKWRVHHH